MYNRNLLHIHLRMQGKFIDRRRSLGGIRGHRDWKRFAPHDLWFQLAHLAGKMRGG